MAPVLPSTTSTNTKPTEPPKSWKKINEERKALKKKRKQEKLIKTLEKSNKLEEELANGVNVAEVAPNPNPSTVSIAVPGSILENAQSAELRSYVAGQIARAACIFRVNEIIVFDDVGLATARETKRNYEVDDNAAGDGDGSAFSTSHTVRSSSLQLARILQYLECPQYLRKFFFPLHKDLKYSGLLNPLDAPHHLRQQNVFRYREGIIAEKKAKDGHSYVNAGLLNDVLVDKAIEVGVRVTVKLENLNDTSRKLRGTVVSPDEPRRETGVYWGYTVRIAHSLAEIFTKSPYSEGYDLTVGTSDRGGNVHEVEQKSYKYNHLLIVFGGLKGLEAALANDDKLNVDDPELLFDHYVNVLPKQGSRTIRTEEALLIALAALQEKFNPQMPDMEEDLKEFLPRSEDTGLTQQPPPSQQYNKKEKRRKQHTEEGDQLEQQQLDGNSKNNTVERNLTTSKFQNRTQNVERENGSDCIEGEVTKNKFINPANKFRNHHINSSDAVEKIKCAATNKFRNSRPKNVDDMEIDDIEVVAANDTSKTKAKTFNASLGDLSRFD